MTEEQKRKKRNDESIFPIQEGMVVFKGLQLPALTTLEHMETMESYDINANDCFVITYPKSGTMWMQEIMSLLRDGDTSKADTLLNVQRVPFLETVVPPEQASQMQLSEERVIKSHLPPDMAPRQIWSVKPKVVVVLRNPRDIAVSFYHFHQIFKFQPQWDRGWDEFLETFMTGCCMYGDWFDWVQAWWKVKDDSHMMFLTYEWMIAHHKEAIERVARFMGKDADPGFLKVVVERTTFSSMKNHNLINGTNIPDVIDVEKVPFFRKGQPGDWKNYFTVAQSEKFDRIYRERMVGYENLDEFLNRMI